jgi:predicted enzyme related to lactoylglutathione lyase
MFKKISTIIIWSEDWKKLAAWYQDVFNFKVIEEINHPKDTGVLWELPDGGPWLWVGQHSEVKGQNKDPLRIMFNINVDSVQKAYDYLVSKGTKVIAKPFKAPTFDKYFATFSDPDGNTFQIIGLL